MSLPSVPEFHCPLVCLPGVADVWCGSYDFKEVQATGNPMILDIGANCGAYSLRALWHNPTGTIHAYEPDPETFAFLRRNCETRIICHNQAVGDPGLASMFRGNNPLCSSQYANTETIEETFPVEVLDPAFLPTADIVKIDTEGAEGYIVERLPFIPKLLALEWHGDDNRQRVEKALTGKMKLISSRQFCPGLGILKYIAI